MPSSVVHHVRANANQRSRSSMPVRPGAAARVTWTLECRELHAQNSFARGTRKGPPATRECRRERDVRPLQAYDAHGPNQIPTLRTASRNLQLVHGATLPLLRNFRRIICREFIGLVGVWISH